MSVGAGTAHSLDPERADSDTSRRPEHIFPQNEAQLTTRQWKLVVTEIGSTAPIAETAVEAPNWMAGIKLARGRIGEPEAIPVGASCTVAPDGRVTVFDATRRRSYVLTPLAEGPPGHSAEPASPRIAAAEHPANPFSAHPASSQGMAGAPAPARRERPKTMAYILDGPLPAPPGAAPIPVGTQAPRPSAPGAGRVETQAFATSTPTPPAPKVQLSPPAPAPAAAAPSASVPSERSAMKRTMAFIPGQFDLPPLPTREVVVGSKPVPTPPAAPVAEVAAAAATSTDIRVLFERDVPPSDESPLHYHVIGLFVPVDRSTVELERSMHAELLRVRATIDGPQEGHFVQVFAYREPVTEPTEDAEVAQLQWRGWRREAAVRFPQLEAQTATQVIPGAERYPTAAADPRLGDLLDAFEDVWFLATPRSGLEFAARVLEDLFPESHVLCAGLALDGSGFVPTSFRGALAGYVPPKRVAPEGLVQLALAGGGRPIALPDPSADARVDIVAEGVGTGPILAAVAPHAGEALGYVRVARSKASPAFDAIDSEILRAVVERLGLFLRLRGACIDSGD